MNEEQFSQVSQLYSLFNFGKLSTFVLSILILTLAVKVVNYLADQLEVAFPARRLFISQTKTIITFLSYIIGINFLFFAIIKPPKELMLAAGGSVAVALGLSMKDLVASIVAGIILLFDRPFQVGDRVTFDGIYGEITSIGLRAVRLVTLDDNLVTIPNSKFITDSVASGNAGALDMMVVVNFYLDINVDIHLAKRKLHDVISTSKYVFLKKPIIQVVKEEMVLGAPALVLTAKCYVLDVHYEKALETDIYERGNMEFRDFLRPRRAQLQEG